MQVYSFDLLGISKAMPISTGEQLIGTVLIGALYFHEWTTVKQFSIGVLAVVLIIVGVVIIALKGRGRANGGNAGQSLAYALGVLTISSFGLIGYAVIPRVFNLNGWDMLLPQSLAMWVSMFLFISVVPGNQIWSAKSWQNIVTGMCFAVANLAILISNQVNGLAIGYTLSQLNVVIATLGGLFILHEHHGKNGRLRISVGLTLVIAGAIFIGTTR
jgi:glucose uptake protein